LIKNTTNTAAAWMKNGLAFCPKIGSRDFIIKFCLTT